MQATFTFLLITLTLASSLTAPNLPQDFSVDFLVTEANSGRKGTFVVAYYTSKQNFSQVNEMENLFTLVACGNPPYRHIIANDYWNEVCYPGCLYNKDCTSSDSCRSCKVEDPWMALKKSSFMGACPGRESSSQYWSFIDGVYRTNFCLDKNAVPIYMQTLAPSLNVTMQVENWDPTPPEFYQFYLPEECSSCSPLGFVRRTLSLSAINRNVFDVLNLRF